MKNWFGKILLYGFFASVVAGQLVRINISSQSSGAILLIDLLIGLNLIMLTGWLFVKKEWHKFFKALLRSKLALILILFMLWSLITLFVGAREFNTGVGLVGFAYWIRLSSALSLGLMFWYIQPIEALLVRKAFLISGFALIILGYLQLFFIRDFSFMTVYGWDPHYGRMLSTFFDPNFFGVFLVLYLLVVLADIFSPKKTFGSLVAAIILVLAWVGLYLTFSRSAWVSGAIAMTIFGLLKNWKTGVTILLIFVVVSLIPSRLNDRLAQTMTTINNQTISSSTSQSASDLAKVTQDPSGASRILSYKKAWSLIKHNYLFGVGYNLYGFALEKTGLASAEGVESNLSSQGSDNSMLNVLATTGALGLALFVLIYISILLGLVKECLSGNWHAGALGCFMVGWLASSFLNNTLLYIFLLAPFAILAASIIKRRDVKIDE